MPKIHPLAIVDSSAELADDVEVGPFCVVEAGVIIGKGTVLEAHSIIRSGTELGEYNVISNSAVLGGAPQDRKYSGEPTFLKIGNHNIIREFVTIHRAVGEGKYTEVGNNNFLMAYTHLGHNGRIGDDTTIANNCAMAGYVTIEDKVTIGGLVGIHQYCRVGKVAMIGGFTKVNRDVPPFMLAEGEGQEVRDINAIGLRRIGISSETRLGLHKACRLLFKSQLGLSNAMETVRREIPMSPEIEYLLEFEARRFNGKNGRGDQP